MDENSPAFSPEKLQQFVNGELSAAEEAPIIAHLAENEGSLALVDELWAQKGLDKAVEAARVPLDQERAQRVKSRVVRRIHQSDLALNVFSFGTQGFISVALGLLRPMTAVRPAKPKER